MIYSNWKFHFSCYSQNVSVVINSGLLQPHIVFSNVLKFSNRILYSIYVDRWLPFCCLCYWLSFMSLLFVANPFFWLLSSYWWCSLQCMVDWSEITEFFQSSSLILLFIYYSDFALHGFVTSTNPHFASTHD